MSLRFVYWTNSLSIVDVFPVIVSEYIIYVWLSSLRLPLVTLALHAGAAERQPFRFREPENHDHDPKQGF